MVTAGGFKPPSATLKGWYPRSLDDAVVWQASQDSHLDPSGSKPGILLYTTSLLITSRQGETSNGNQPCGHN